MNQTFGFFRRLSRFLFVPLALLFLAAILSCSHSAKSKKITIAVALLPSEQVAYSEILDDFTRKTGISVTLVAQQYDQIRSVIEAEAQAGEGELDLAELDIYMLPLMRSYMLPLDSFSIALTDLKKHSPAVAWKAGRLGTPPKMYYIPDRLNWQALIYNAKVLSRPPRTWQELLAVGRKYPGQIGFKAARYEGLICDLFPFIWEAGGDPLHPNTPEAFQAMTFLKKLAPAFNPAVRSYKENSILQAEEHQEILLHENWPFVVPLLKQKGLLDTYFKTAPLPAGPSGTATILGGGYLGIPKTAPHPKFAARLIDYLTSVDVQKKLVEELGWFPVREEGWEAMTAQDKIDYSGFLAMKKEVRARPSVPFYPELSQIWQDGFYQMIFENKNIPSVLQNMQKKIDALAGQTPK